MSQRISPTDLIALNDEIAMLVRAGVPLELGLRELGGSVKSGLGQVNLDLARRMGEGQSLTQSLAETLPGLPTVYCAVIDAGLKSGDLPRALESLTQFAQQGTELRRRIEFSFLYPLIVFFLAYLLFVFFVVGSADRWQGLMVGYSPTQDVAVSILKGLASSWRVWVPIPPALVMLLIGWWLLVARYSFLPDRRPSRLLSVIPGLKSVVECWHWSNFCDLFATLLEHQVPLPTAIKLAADATGSRTIHQQMTAVSTDLESGRSMSDSLRGRGIPGYLRWTLGAAQTPSALCGAIRHGTELYRSRAAFRADAIKMWLPMATILIVGGGAVLLYALSMALPLRALFEQLNRDGMH